MYVYNKQRVWHTGHSDEEDNQDEGPAERANARQNRAPANGRIDQYFGGEKGAGLRLSYAGAGHPLTLLMYAPLHRATAYADEPAGLKRRMVPLQRVRSRLLKLSRCWS